MYNNKQRKLGQIYAEKGESHPLKTGKKWGQVARLKFYIQLPNPVLSVPKA